MLSPCSPAPSRRKPQRGLSLVELMVGIAIGMFIVAAAVLGMSTSMQENRQLLLEARLQQDLRATMDLITRDMRRAGYWANAQTGVWTSGATTVTANPYNAIGIMPARPAKVASTAPVTADGTASQNISYSWANDTNNTLDNGETVSFRLESGKIQMQLSGGTWQDVTDPGTVVVTAFTITPTATWLPLYPQCPSACDPLTQNCPELVIRSVSVSITGRTPDASTGVQRTLNSRVRIRNDQLTGACP